MFQQFPLMPDYQVKVKFNRKKIIDSKQKIFLLPIGTEDMFIWCQSYHKLYYQMKRSKSFFLLKK